MSWILSNGKLFLICIGLSFLSCIGITGRFYYDKYVDTIPVIKEVKVDITEYSPFLKDSKVAKFNYESSLKLSEDLPKIDGATALYPMYSSFVNATYPEKIYDPENSEVLCSTTSKAYENLINGKVDVIFCAEPSKKQIDVALTNGIHFKMTPIGKEAFVFFVNSKNKVKNISSNNIKNIYSGRIKNWFAISGSFSSIKVFQRPENSGSQTMLEKIIGDEKIIEPLKNDVIDGMGEIIKHTADYKNYKNAIGYSFLYYSTQMVQNGSIKLLSIDNVYPSKDTIKDGTYPYSSSFYAITRSETTENTKKLIDWILSKEGQFLVKKTPLYRRL